MPVAATAIETPRYAAASARPGRLRDGSLSETDRMCSLAIHLSPFSLVLLGGVWPIAMLAPLIIWLVRKDQSVFNDDHGREVVNFGISFVIWHVVLTISVIGIFLMPVLWVVAVVNLIRGAIAASRGEYFRYPVTIRFL